MTCRIDELMDKETQRQQTTINLIASENYSSPAVRSAMSSTLANKYAEGYPGKRYYTGCAVADEVEQCAIDLCKELFHTEHANVQPHAGSQANMTAYFATLKPGDTIMGMSLAEGGHLTHGHGVNFSGSIYKSVPYTVNRETELLDYDEIERLAQEHKPNILIAGASAYSRTIDFARFASIAKNCGAYLLADIAHIAGLIAADVHPSPVGHADLITSTTHKTLRGPRGAIIMATPELAERVDKAIIPGTQGGPFLHAIAAKALCFQEALTPAFKEYQQRVIDNAQAMANYFSDHGYRIVSGGTDNHLFILDVTSKNLTGRQADRALEIAGITVSRSCIPFDTQKPWVTSGIRIGTPALSTRGMGRKEATEIAQLVDEVLSHHEDAHRLELVKEKVLSLCKKFPIEV
jgi:glycine hydroxymethyltransferase